MKAYSMRLRAVILNDTRGDNHFGCMRVMRVIEENLATRGIDVTATSLVRNDWSKDKRFLSAMGVSDLVVINGEGTLHHGSRHGLKLLSVLDHPARGTTPVALINAVYQANPAEWSEQLSRLSLISTRDSWSAKEVSTAIGRHIEYVPDLSLAEGEITLATLPERKRLLVGDSVNRTVSRQLLDLANTRADARYLPILTSIKPPKPHFPPARRFLRQTYINFHTAAFVRLYPQTEINTEEAGFVHSLFTGYLHLTGRFHAVCLCLATRTPFLALESNSWKISALLSDFGLSSDRIVTFDEARRRLQNKDRFDFSDLEHQRISDGLSASMEGASKLFDRLLLLAKSRQNYA